MKFAKRTLLASSLALLIVATAANAQFKLPGVLGGNSATNSDSTNGDAAVAQDALVRSFVGSQVEVLAAQSLLAKAYGLNDQAAVLDAEQKALASGATDRGSLKKSIETSDNANEIISAKQAASSELSAEGKEYYEQSLPHLIKGVVGARAMIGQAGKFTSAAKGSAGGGLMGMGSALTKLAAGAFVVKSTPSYTKSLFDVFKKTMSISRSNGVKVPSDATAALGTL